jgi:hypothetical protein
MAFKTFNRALYVELESTEGTAETPGDGDPSAYLESIDPTYSVTSMMYERDPTTGAITDTPQTVPGIGASATEPCAAVEFSFTIELTGSGNPGTAPHWGRLLKCCGFDQSEVAVCTTDAIADVSAAPHLFHDREHLAAHSSTTIYAAANCIGRCVGDTFQGATDSYLFFDRNGGSGGAASVEVDDADIISGQVGNGSPRFTASSDSTGDATNTPGGIAWTPTNERAGGLGGGNSSSCTIRLVYDSTTGGYIEGVGCRGNVEFVFAAGDRVLMNYTMTGRLNRYAGSGSANDAPVMAGTCSLNNQTSESACTGAGGTWYPQTIPPALVGVSLGIQDTSFDSASLAPYTGSIFTTMTINMGNEVTLREDSNASGGYDVAYITGRNPTMTFNPDAVDEATFGFWTQFLSGDVTRAELQVGSSATPSTGLFTFRMPAMQFTGIADGNRDEVMVYDSTTTLTGGDYGSSIKYEHSNIQATSPQMNDRLGTNNEFVLVHH